MKITYILSFLTLFSFTEKSIGQTELVTSGIYLTVSDYQNNKLIEEAACTNDKEKFERHDLFSRSTFSVINKDKKLTYLKKDIYAYRDCDNKVWRFYNNKEYQLLETSDICIYVIRKVVLNGRTVEKDPIYFFSKGPGNEVKELTIENLKKQYTHNPVFFALLDQELKNGKTLHSFDEVHKMYLLNYLLYAEKK